MESLQTEDGQFFVRSLAQFIRQHEKALANSLQLTVNKRQPQQNSTSKNGSSNSTGPTSSNNSNNNSTSSLASALSFAGLKFTSSNMKSAHLTLTPHHLFYLLSRIDELGIKVGPMNVRIESIHSDASQINYVSFLQSRALPPKGRSDADSIHSVSSVRSVMSSMSSFWSSIGLGSSQSKTEKARAATEADLKYLYSAFTKLPSLRLTADPRARLIQGYEEFPFDTAVPLFAFKNVQQLDIIDMDFRQFHGWDRLADQLCLLTIKRGNLDDPMDLLTNIVLDDAERRRRRSTRNNFEPPSTPSWTMPSTPSTPFIDYPQSQSDPGSPGEESTPSGSPNMHDHHVEEQVYMSNKHKTNLQIATGNMSPKRPTAGRPASSYRHARSYSSKIRRSGSGSSNSSDYSSTPLRTDSSGNILGNALPPSKWQRLKYLSLADNALTSLAASSIAPLTSSLRSFNLSSNLFAEIPDSLATLTRLTSLDLSNCMIDSLQSLARSPLPAITTIKLKSNRLRSLAGVERLLSLENLHVQDNYLADPMEAARLTGIPNLRRIWVKHNPMTKKADYRVKIMNVFRQTPGYVDDILIDDLPASYVERKSLVPRAPEIERIPSNIPSRAMEGPVIIQRTLPSSNEEQPVETVSSQGQYEATNTGARRKKGIHRRIVDLAARDDESQNFEPSKQIRIQDGSAKSTIVANTKDEILTLDVQPAMSDTSDVDLGPSESSDSIATLHDQQDDEYKSKVEALRQQFGNNWLNALGEQQWHADHHFANEAEQLHSKLYLVSPMVVTGARSLG